ncbi:MAG: tetratricopeptide repeat protein [Deltaproteobacteria bacterium]|nr:tetratricopeptide repeat protein [Deltaproteobacteria bacterium]
MTQKSVIVMMACVFSLMLLVGCSSYMKGKMHLEWENYEAAIRDFQEELARNPDNWQCRQRLGFAYLKAKDADKAVAEFTRVLEAQPDDPFSTYYLGQAYLEKGERRKTIETWKTYRNSAEPLVEEEIKKQMTLVEIVESMHLARQALSEEEKLKSLPPREGTVAVFYFKDVSPDNRFQHFQKAMAAMITTDLSQVGALQVVERMRVQFLLTEMKLGETGIVERESVPRAGRLLGAENLIVGSMEPGSLAVKTSVASTSKQDVVGAFSVAGEVKQFYVLEKEVVYNVLKVLKVPFTSEEEAKFSQYHTQNLKAVLYFGQGLEALDRGEWKEARDFFGLAVEEDPSFELARRYGEACPSDSSPGLGALGDMSTEGLAVSVEASVEGAMAEQAVAIAESTAGDPGEATPAGPDTGSVSFGW